MWTNYFKIAWRNLLRNRAYSAINIGGLALSLTASMFIGLWVYNERSYDSFHQDADRIYRVVKDFVTRDGTRTPDATTPYALASALQTELPEVASVTGIYPNWNQKYLIKRGNQQFYEEGVYRVDSNFFSVFTFPFILGDARAALTTPESIVLTESAARKYFGTENPIGRQLDLDVNGGVFTVTGVLAAIPNNAHFRFDFLIPLGTLDLNPDTQWKNYVFYTYVKLKPNTDAGRFKAKLQPLFNRHQPDDLNQFYAQELTSIHLTSKLKWELGQNGDQSYVRILSFIALFVLIIAGINYVNLATARSAQRAREVGIRKVAGAYKQSLIAQFLGEGILFALLAGVLAVGLVFLLLPVFNASVEKDLNLWNQHGLIFGLVAIGVAGSVGLVAGVYPALILSSFEPIQVLKGKNLVGGQASWLRQGLVTSQFIVSVGLIFGAIVVTQQLRFLQTTPLGFDKEQVLVLPNVGGLSNLNTIRQQLLSLSGVEKVGASSGVFGGSNWTAAMSRKGSDQGVVVNYMMVDNNALDVLDVRLREGRRFSAQFPSDSTTSLLVNETAVRQLGLSQPIGSVVDANQQGDYRTVIGVVQDFHFASLHNTIKPFAFMVGKQHLSFLFVKVNASNLNATIKTIKHTWEGLVPERPFAYTFLDERFAALHRADTLFERVFTGLTSLALFIACLGLFALATFTTERRTKEIGVRKVLGASVASIVTLLSKDFLKLVLIAIVIASPIAWYAMNEWLADFAYKIDIEWWVFALAGGLAVGIALLTVSFQSVKAALMNPVESLRSE